MNREQAKGYLAAIIDGEGCVKEPRCVYISNTSLEVIEAVAFCCNCLGIPHWVKQEENGPRGRKAIYRLGITRRQGLEAVRKLPLQDPRKVAKLDAALATYKYSRERCAKQRRPAGANRIQVKPRVRQDIGKGVKT